MDSEKDILLLEYMALHMKQQSKAAMRRLRINELPEKKFNCDDPGDVLYEPYLVLEGTSVKRAGCGNYEGSCL